MTAREKECPSIDKPWLKYYSKEAIEADIPSMRMFDYINNACKGYEDNICLEYFGKKITFECFLKNIKYVLKAFVA